MDHFDDDDFELDNEELSDKDKEELNNRFEKERRETENHPLYLQANEVEQTLDALLNSGDEADEMAKSHAGLMHDSMMMVRVKLFSAIQSKNYFISMQNGALIRDHAEFLRLSSHTLNHMGFDKTYVAVFRQEMEKFRKLFRAWAAEIKTIDKDGIEDEWGLF